MQKPTDRTVHQNSWVVDDLDAAIHKWIHELGVGPFFVSEYGDQFSNLTYRGQPGELRMRIGVSQAGPVQIELIQPTTDHPSAYRDMYPAGTSIKEMTVENTTPKASETAIGIKNWA